MTTCGEQRRPDKSDRALLEPYEDQANAMTAKAKRRLAAALQMA